MHDEHWELIKACKEGNLARVQELFHPEDVPFFLACGRDDTTHPLLHATHNLHPAVVQFLVDHDLNPTQRGTVHPYTGDGMVVAELQGASPLELANKMLFHFSRRSKKREALLEIREILLAAETRRRERAQLPPLSPGQFHIFQSPLSIGSRISDTLSPEA